MDDAIRFTKESQHKLIRSKEEQQDKESREPDYSKNNELEDKQQEDTGEIKTTTNQVF